LKVEVRWVEEMEAPKENIYTGWRVLVPNLEERKITLEKKLHQGNPIQRQKSFEFCIWLLYILFQFSQDTNL